MIWQSERSGCLFVGRNPLGVFYTRFYREGVERSWNHEMARTDPYGGLYLR